MVLNNLYYNYAFLKIINNIKLYIMKIVSIIPVKSTSSRIEEKNIKLLGDKPLFLHTLEKLLKIKMIN